MLVHATAIAAAGRAALLLGPPGAGKSDLALRLVTGSFRIGGRRFEPHLVSDDQVLLEALDGRLLARAPLTIAGKIEVRGLGIAALPHAGASAVAIAVNLVQSSQVDRLPEGRKLMSWLGISVPVMELDPFQSSSPAKLLLALAAAASSD